MVVLTGGDEGGILAGVFAMIFFVVAALRVGLDGAFAGHWQLSLVAAFCSSVV